MLRSKIVTIAAITICACTAITAGANDQKGKALPAGQLENKDCAEKNDSGMLSTQARISMQQAEALALAKAAGTTQEIELSRESTDKLIFEVEINQGKQTAEVRIDAITGALLEVEYKSAKQNKRTDHTKESKQET